MPRKPRFAPAGYYSHITQRGNYRQETFFSDADRCSFLDLLGQNADADQVDLLAYCLMPNHFHLIARSTRDDGLSRFMQGLSGQYAKRIHSIRGVKGRFWQGRFFSCVLDRSHLTTALRYVELNPIRAGLVNKVDNYAWSSAAIHTGAAPATTSPRWLDLQTFREIYTVEEWRSLLSDAEPREDLASIRAATQLAHPLGDYGFAERLEAQFGVTLRRTPFQKVGQFAPRHASVA